MLIKKLFGLVPSITVYPPVMMYSVLAAAAYVFVIRLIKLKNNKNAKADNE